LKALARQVGALPGLVDAVSRDNKVHLARLVQMVHRELEARGKRATVGILGLAFKPGVDSTVASVGVALMDALFDYPPLVYDPLVHWHGISTDTPQQLADLAHVVVCTTADGLWRGVQFHAGQTVIDCWRVLDREAVEGAGAKYMALGVGALDGSGGA
jgi:UDP-glucose 6-dehydrogenase